MTAGTGRGDGPPGDGARHAPERAGWDRRMHGHVIARPDGNRARCGGPGLCPVCADELAMVQAAAQNQRRGDADGDCPPCGPCQETLSAAHVAVLRALEIAGKRLVTRNRHRRGETRHVPPHLRHTLTIVPVNDDELDRLLEDVWTLLPEALPDRGDVPRIVRAADTYVRQLLLAGEPHRLEYLATAFDTAGIPR